MAIAAKEFIWIVTRMVIRSVIAYALTGCVMFGGLAASSGLA
jgi:hypothetical protein